MTALKSTRKKSPPGAPVGNKNASRHAGEPTAQVCLRLPESVIEHYRGQAAEQGVPLATLLVQVLLRRP